jgi:hypothetical protein
MSQIRVLFGAAIALFVVALMVRAVRGTKEGASSGSGGVGSRGGRYAEWTKDQPEGRRAPWWESQQSGRPWWYWWQIQPEAGDSWIINYPGYCQWCSLCDSGAGADAQSPFCQGCQANCPYGASARFSL